MHAGGAFFSCRSICGVASGRLMYHKGHESIGLAFLAPPTRMNRVRRSRSVPAVHILMEAVMPKYMIERDLPDAGKLSDTDLQQISAKSCDVLRQMGPDIQWQESYVTDNKIYCVYIAPSEQLIREHAQQGGFPVTQVNPVRRVIDPTTAEARA